MVNVKIGGKIDVQKIHRLIRDDEILVGYPDGVEHPAPSYLRHKISAKTGRRLKKMERAVSRGESMQNSDLARALHYGTEKIPARPWLYLSISSVAEELRRVVKGYYEARMKSEREPEGRYSLDGIGSFLVGAVQRFVRGDFFKSETPNAPATIRRKGSDTPLIDTGFLVNSTTYVTSKGAEKPRVSPVEAKGAAG